MSSPKQLLYRNNRPFPALNSSPVPSSRSRLPLSLALGATLAGCAVDPSSFRISLPTIGLPAGPSLTQPGVSAPSAPKPPVPPKREPDLILPPPGGAPQPIPLKPPATSPTPIPGYPYPTPIQPTASPVPIGQPPPNTGAGTFLPDQAIRVFQLTNQARADAGIAPLATDSAMDRLAGSRSQDMGDRNYFSHTTPENTNLFDMMRQLGISYTSAGENIALNSAGPTQTADVAFNGWMNSSGHKTNILRTSYGHLGVGVYRTTTGKTYLTQVFKN